METFEQIMQRMLDRVPNSFDKREGSVIWDALAPCGVEIQLLQIQLEHFMNEIFVDTASRESLIRHAMERGVEPYKSSYAVLMMYTTPTNLNIPIGTRFNLNDLNYTVTEKHTDGEYYVKCETLGGRGNDNFGVAIPIDYIDGLQTCEITELIIPAEDDEETEHFRARYLESFQSQAFGGNIADYKEKTIAISGVGGVKVEPTWAGGGTVKLTIQNSDYDVPSTELVNLVQERIDPVGHSGKGVGLAPVGHVVTVVPIASQSINISMTIDYASGWSWAEVKPYVEQAIDDYFYELSKDWMITDNIIVRISGIESRLISITGIIDVSGLMLNGASANVQLSGDKIPKRGEITHA